MGLFYVRYDKHMRTCADRGGRFNRMPIYARWVRRWRLENRSENIWRVLDTKKKPRDHAPRFFFHHPMRIRPAVKTNHVCRLSFYLIPEHSHTINIRYSHVNMPPLTRPWKTGVIHTPCPCYHSFTNNVHSIYIHPRRQPQLNPGLTFPVISFPPHFSRGQFSH